MKPQPYSYCFLRYLPSPESGEQVNVGALLYAPESRFLGFLGSSRYARLSHCFADFEQDGYRRMMSRIEAHFSKLSKQHTPDNGDLLSASARPQSAREIALQVVPDDDAALRWSNSGGGETIDPESELADIFQYYIERHNTGASRKGRDEKTVYTEVYRPAFENPKVSKHIQEHEIIAPLDRHVFHQAWKNGIWNVYETISFDLIEADAIHNKAFRWDSRANHLSAAPDSPAIHYLIGAPTDSRNKKAYAKAKDILASSRKAILVEENEATDFAKDLESRITSQLA